MARIVQKAARMMRGEREMGVIVIVSHNGGGVKLCQAGHSEQSLLMATKEAHEMLDKDRVALRKAVFERGAEYESPIGPDLLK